MGRQFVVRNSGRSGECGANALAQGPQWSLYPDALAKSQNLLHNRNGGFRRRPTIIPVAHEAVINGLSPRNLRSIPWQLAQGENYVVWLWNEHPSAADIAIDGTLTQVAKFRIDAVTENELPPEFQPRMGTDRIGTLKFALADASEQYFTGNVKELALAVHETGLYFTDNRGDHYPFVIRRRLNILEGTAATLTNSARALVQIDYAANSEYTDDLVVVPFTVNIGAVGASFPTLREIDAQGNAVWEIRDAINSRDFLISVSPETNRTTNAMGVVSSTHHIVSVTSPQGWTGALSVDFYLYSPVVEASRVNYQGVSYTALQDITGIGVPIPVPTPTNNKVDWSWGKARDDAAIERDPTIHDQAELIIPYQQGFLSIPMSSANNAGIWSHDGRNWKSVRNQFEGIAAYAPSGSYAFNRFSPTFVELGDAVYELTATPTGTPGAPNSGWTLVGYALTAPGDNDLNWKSAREFNARENYEQDEWIVFDDRPWRAVREHGYDATAGTFTDSLAAIPPSNPLYWKEGGFDDSLPEWSPNASYTQARGENADFQVEYAGRNYYRPYTGSDSHAFTAAEDSSFTAPTDEFIYYRSSSEGTSDQVRFKVIPIRGSGLGLVNLGPPASITGNRQDGLRTAGTAGGTVLDAGLQRLWGGENYVFNSNYIITGGNGEAQGKTIYTGPEGIGYSNSSIFNGLGFTRRRSTDTILVNRAWACAWNPAIGYPTAVGVKDGSLWFGGHKDPRYAGMIWKSSTDNFFDFGTHFRKFTEDDTDTGGIDESMDQQDIIIADRLPTYGLEINTSLVNGITGFFSEATNLLIFTPTTIHDFLTAPLAGTENAGSTRLGFVDTASVSPDNMAVIDESLFVFDNRQNTAVKERINISDLTETRYDPVRVDEVKGYDKLNAVSKVSAARLSTIHGDLVFYIDGSGDRVSVYNTVTEGGTPLMACWSEWLIDNPRYKWSDIWQSGNKVGVAVFDTETSQYLLGEFNFQGTHDDFAGNVEDVKAVAIMPPALSPNIDGFGAFYPTGYIEANVYVEDSEDIQVTVPADETAPGGEQVRELQMTSGVCGFRPIGRHYARVDPNVTSLPPQNAMKVESVAGKAFGVSLMEIVAQTHQREIGVRVRKAKRQSRDVPTTLRAAQARSQRGRRR